MKTAKIKIGRCWQDLNQTLGSCKILNEQNMPIFASLSLERGWRNNEQNVSCIPLGEYEVVLEYSNKFKKELWEIKGVDGRSETKFHSLNFWRDSNGCVGLGLKTADMDGDGYLDITNSIATMRRFHEAIEGFDEVKLIIYNEN